MPSCWRCNFSGKSNSSAKNSVQTLPLSVPRINFPSASNAARWCRPERKRVYFLLPTDNSVAAVMFESHEPALRAAGSHPSVQTKCFKTRDLPVSLSPANRFLLGLKVSLRALASFSDTSQSA